MSVNKSTKRTLLMSVLMSSPGPLVVGLGLMLGQSSTQIADFVRRSAELFAIIVAFVVYLITTKTTNTNTVKKQKLEDFSNIFVGFMMSIAGIIMFIIAITSKNQDKGNVTAGLVIAVLGVVANTIFWIKYSKLSKIEYNKIIFIQCRLYRAKSLVDICVTIALLSVLILPQHPVSFYLDLVGSIIVALYLTWCGIQTIFEKVKYKSKKQ